MTRTAETGQRSNPWRIARWTTAGLLLTAPLVAMQFTDDVKWTPIDFVAMGAMLAAACGAYDFATGITGNGTYRAAAALAIGTGFFLVGSNLAVGFIGSENNPANLMFGGVLAVGILGALITRFRARGMALALGATAAAQALVGAIAVIGGMDDALTLTALTGMFAALWLTSAGLFRKAARDQAAAAAAP